MWKSFLVLTVVAFSQLGWAQAIPEQTDRADVASFYNLEENSLGLKGYDPVAYFTEDAAIEGEKTITVAFGGVTYRFSSEENKELFMADPTKYEPTYGGWCAWAMANNAYADIDPKLYTLNGDRLHFFISRGAKARFDRDLELREKAADDFWKSESGESPRL
jgi:YHS domain-containing protein